MVSVTTGHYRILEQQDIVMCASASDQILARRTLARGHLRAFRIFYYISLCYSVTPQLGQQ